MQIGIVALGWTQHTTQALSVCLKPRKWREWRAAEFNYILTIHQASEQSGILSHYVRSPVYTQRLADREWEKKSKGEGRHGYNMLTVLPLLCVFLAVLAPWEEPSYSVPTHLEWQRMGGPCSAPSLVKLALVLVGRCLKHAQWHHISSLQFRCKNCNRTISTWKRSLGW